MFIETHINKVGKKKKSNAVDLQVAFFLPRLCLFLVLTCQVENFLLFSHPFRAGQRNFNRASGKSLFSNQERFCHSHVSG